MTEEYLPTIEIEPPAAVPQRSIIWLHGLGADGADFVSIVPELQLPSMLGIRFIFPHAPIMPVTVNNGYKMRAWFDIPATAIHENIDEEGIAKSVNSINLLIEKEISRGIAPKHIVLAGFSQGAMIALTTGLCYPQALGGVIALSGCLPLANKVFERASAANHQLPIFAAHGTEDVVVPYALGKATYAALKQMGYSVSWHSYPMPHSVCTEEVKDISQWIQDAWRKDDPLVY
ncbi:MAG: carboxylesterase [Gammaproteobacteria bacterium]|nr:MAG: carboxylesterase [Gammaproteobacteria bacterium]